MNVFVGIMIPFLGTAAGAAMVFFMRDAIKPAVQKNASGLRFRSNDRGIGVVFADPGYGYGFWNGETLFSSGCGRISSGDRVPSDDGQDRPLTSI